jgi:hypothetical protein
MCLWGLLMLIERCQQCRLDLNPWPSPWWGGCSATMLLPSRPVDLKLILLDWIISRRFRPVQNTPAYSCPAVLGFAQYSLEGSFVQHNWFASKTLSVSIDASIIDLHFSSPMICVNSFGYISISRLSVFVLSFGFVHLNFSFWWYPDFCYDNIQNNGITFINFGL